MPAANFRQQYQTLLQVEQSFPSSPSLEWSQVTANPAKKKAEKRRVQFNATVNVRPIRHVDRISEDEKRDTWFCQQEYKQMKEDISRAVRVMAVGVYEGDDSENCSRGLESRTRAGAIRRRENKWVAINEVLDEQDRQHELQLFDDVLLREVYLKESKHCRREAFEMGVRDQEEARSLHVDDESDEEGSEDEMDYCDIDNMRSMMTAPTRNISAMSRDE
jgi:hypothetical protein